MSSMIRVRERKDRPLPHWALDDTPATKRRRAALAKRRHEIVAATLDWERMTYEELHGFMMAVAVLRGDLYDELRDRRDELLKARGVRP